MDSIIGKKATHILSFSFQRAADVTDEDFVEFRRVFLQGFPLRHEWKCPKGDQNVTVSWNAADGGLYYTRSVYATQWVVEATRDAVYQTQYDSARFPRRKFRVMFNVLKVLGDDTIGCITPQ